MRKGHSKLKAKASRRAARARSYVARLKSSMVAPTASKQSPRRRWAGRALMVAGIAAIVIILFGNRGFRRLLSNTIYLRRLNSGIVALKEEQARLKARIAAVRGDDVELERVARKELGYLKSGEVEYRFSPPGKRER